MMPAPEGSHRAVTATHHHRRPGHQTGGPRGLRRDRPDHRGGGDDVGEQRARQVGGLDQLGRPLPRRLVVGVRAGRVGRVRGQHTGQPVGDEVLGQHHGARPGEDLGLLVPHPHDLGQRVRRVEPVSGDLVPLGHPDPVDQRGGLRHRAGIGPDDRRPHRRPGLVQQHRAHHLTGERDHLDVLGPHRCLAEQVLRRGAQGRPPVLRVLLGLAPRTEVGAVGGGDGRQHLAVVTDQRGLVARGAQVVGDDHEGATGW